MCKIKNLFMRINLLYNIFNLKFYIKYLISKFNLNILFKFFKKDFIILKPVSLDLSL